MSSRAEFRQKMAEAFSLTELATLCSDLGVDADEIPGRENGKSYWSDQIIEYFERRNRLPDLIRALKAARNAIDWTYAPSPATAAAAVLAGRLSPAMLAGGAALIAVATLALFLANRPAPEVAATATAAVTAQPSVAPLAAATGTSAPTPMPAGHYNILFVDFGQMERGALKALPEGARLSRNTAEGFKRYLNEGLPPDVQLDFPPLVWHSDDAAKNGWAPGPLSTITDAQRLAERSGAQMVVFGNFVISDTSSALELGFYVAKVANAADEIVGPYQLGAPIAVRWPMSADGEQAARLSLNDRNRLLSRFALGLAYDLYGRSSQALQVFQSADQSLPAEYRTGREVLYFFIAREHLLLRQTADAERFHRKALELNPNYTRAHLGLGDVYFQYAAAITNAQQLLQSDPLRQADEQYGLAESQAALAPDVPQLLPLARLGLGLVAQLRAKAQFDMGALDDARSGAIEAMRLIEPALAELSQRVEGQRRTLALGYLNLAEASWISARMAVGPDGDGTDDQKRQRDAYYAKANTAYTACGALDIGTDAFLSEKIVAACKANQRRMSAELP